MLSNDKARNVIAISKGVILVFGAVTSVGKTTLVECRRMISDFAKSRSGTPRINKSFLLDQEQAPYW